MKRKTNVQLVRHLMEFSRHGALAQMFIMQALLQYSEKVAAADPKECDSPMISGAAWVGVATEIRDAINAHLNGGR